MKRFLAITLGAMLVLSSLTYGKGKIQNGIDSVKASQETSTTIKTETGSITKINREATTTEATTETTTSAHRAIAVGEENNSIVMNGSTYEYMGNTMVPLRGIAEALGYAVQWNSELKAVEISNDDVKVDFNTGVNSYVITKNKDLKAGTPVSLATAPVIKDGSTYVPLELFRMLNSQQYDIVIKNNTVVISPKTAEDVTEETTVVDNSLSLRGGEINKIDNGGKKQANADAKVDSDKKIVNETTTFSINKEATTESTTKAYVGGKNSVNPMVEYDTAAQAVFYIAATIFPAAAQAAAELKINLNTVDIEGYTLEHVYVVSGLILQLDYTNGSKDFSVRIAKGTDDISSDYKKYSTLAKYTVNGCLATLEGDKINYPKATWTDKTYTYAVTNNSNLKEHEMAKIANEVAYFVAK